jgi:hypothetical protein
MSSLLVIGALITRRAYLTVQSYHTGRADTLHPCCSSWMSLDSIERRILALEMRREIVIISADAVVAAAAVVACT